MLCSQHTLVHDLLLLLLSLVDQVLEPDMSRSFHPLVALRAVCILETNDQTITPLAMESLANTVLMENVFACELDH